MAELDPLVAEGTPDAPEASAADTKEEDFPFDFMESSDPDTLDSAEAPESDTQGHSDAAPQSNQSEPDRFDITRTPLEDVPESVRPYVEQARAQHRALQGEYTRTSQEIAQMRQQFDRERAQYLQTIQQSAQPAAPQQPQDPLADIYQALDPTERDAIGTVDRVVQIRMQQLMEDTQSRMAAMEEENQQLRHSSQQAQQYFQAQAEGVVRNELDEARTLYPNADLNQWGDAIIQLRKTMNPSTRKQFTVAEAYARLSGEAAQGSQELQQRQAQVRQQAQRRVATRGSDSGNGIVGDNTELSKDEALKNFPAFFE